MKVITNDIVSIKAGTSMTFMLDSYKACLNAKQLAFQAGAYRKPEDVERYATSIDSHRCCLTITALPKK